MKAQVIIRRLSTTALLTAGLALSSCESIPAEAKTGGPKPLAYTTIKGSSTWQICQHAIEVFREDGYRLSSYLGSDIYFEKKGSPLAVWSYGSWGANSVVIRPKVSVIELSDGNHFVRCDSSVEEHRYGNLGIKPKNQRIAGTFSYQSLLNKVKKRAQADAG